LQKFFERSDYNRDGSLSGSELQRAIAAAIADEKEITGPSVVEGKKAGIQVGQYAPDFELQPVEPHPALQKWLGDGASVNMEHGVKLSQLVGKAPIMLFFGSYT